MEVLSGDNNYTTVRFDNIEVVDLSRCLYVIRHYFDKLDPGMLRISEERAVELEQDFAEVLNFGLDGCQE